MFFLDNYKVRIYILPKRTLLLCSLTDVYIYSLDMRRMNEEMKILEKDNTKIYENYSAVQKLQKTS